MPCQLLFRALDGRTRCLQFDGTYVHEPALRARLAAAEGSPDDLRLALGCRDVRIGETLYAAANGSLPFVTLLPRLLGGKGGFGSLLRGAGKSKHKGEENNDSCRDLQGRRLRHANLEQQLQKWTETAAQRELEKLGAAHITRHEREAETARVAALAAQAAQAVVGVTAESVAAAVERGLAAASAKRKADAEAGPARPHGRGVMWALPDEDDDPEDDDNGLGLVAPPHLASSTASGPDTGVAATSERPPHPPPPAAPAAPAAPVTPAPASPAADAEVPPPPAPPPAAPSVPLLDVAAVGDVAELEALGLERLKVELAGHGLKCGGSLKERAMRLYLLKTTPLDQLDRKHLAKKS